MAGTLKNTTRKAAKPKTTKAAADAASTVPNAAADKTGAGGRPSKFTQDVRRRIVEALAAGNTRETAARYGGVHPATFFSWMQRADENHPEYSPEFYEFSEAIKKAESEAEVSAVATIKKAGTGYNVPRTTIKTKTYLEPRKQKDGSFLYVEVSETETTTVETREFSWQAAAWWLERRKPKDWREVKTLNVSNIPDDKLVELLEADARISEDGDKSDDQTSGS